TYDHRTLKIELPVRSAVLKQCTGGLVVRWVTTSESPLLYVFFCRWVDPIYLHEGVIQDQVVETLWLKVKRGVVLAKVVHLLGLSICMWLKLTINYSL
ncbi:hypothetical protein EJ02DRAFT_359757, partial [Clathrospora elynae]